jgi:hypothetical protein
MFPGTGNEMISEESMKPSVRGRGRRQSNTRPAAILIFNTNNKT